MRLKIEAETIIDDKPRTGEMKGGENHFNGDYSERSSSMPAAKDSNIASKKGAALADTFLLSFFFSDLFI